MVVLQGERAGEGADPLRYHAAMHRPLAWIPRWRHAAAIAAAALSFGAVAHAADPAAVDDAPLFGRAPENDAERQALLARIEAVGRRGFLYEVRSAREPGPRAGKRLFLYGTMHVGRAGSEPFNGPLLQALRQSQRLALEADPSDAPTNQRIAAELGQYAAGDALDQHIPPPLMERVAAFGARHGMPAERIARFKPWLLANMVVLTGIVGTGLEPAMGSEMYLAGFARGMQLPVVEIEGLESQLRMLAALPEPLQSAQLAEAFAEEDRGEAKKELQALFDLWMKGDRAAGDAIVAEMHRDADGKPFERYFVDVFIDGRNGAMADRAEHYLERPGNTFFAVGALHLFGPRGLIAELERRGYRVSDLQT